MLLYCQYYYSCSFTSFVILSCPCFVILALIGLSSICVLSFRIFSDVGLLCYLLWTIFYIFLVFISPFYKTLPCLNSVYRQILQYVSCWLSLNDLVVLYCFNHYFNDISMVTLFEHQFYCIFSSRFFIVLLVDFTLWMASSKWKPNIQILRQNSSLSDRNGKSSYLPFTLS